ncbi:hypothetical protein HD553DRAFT_166857 [Filobasidium floriforme]|uniref:uncharacterized protein n=1 Tax=Filobasidium floriforme TaxID=5210 RepID=UPI001E8D24E5|nr:uncharacterized protein HD553DRAFT_166857 [Filobasidium floriforme]KAH8077861.1 hypothetical protein HD553DRAFT_166857 [Filobasidium floriforme]
MSEPDTLESFISAKFTALALSIPEDDVEYIARLVEEEELEDDDKKEGVKGMLEGFLPMKDGQTPEDPDFDLDPTITNIIDHWRDRRAAAAQEAAAQEAAAEGEEGAEGDGDTGSESDSGSDDGEGDGDGQGGSRKPSTSTPAEKKAHRAKVKAQTSLIASLSPEELAAAQRRALLAQYGYVEDENVVQDDTSGGARGETLRKREEEKEAKERRALIDAAIRGEAKRKKKSKRARETVDLMAPNLNKEKVQVKAQMLRQIAKQESQSVQARDKAALEKQRADQAKAKADKQKKAQKQERRA